MSSPVSPAGSSYPVASLYVGDLHPDVTEGMLLKKFSTAGQVLSVKVCRDMIKRRSLGYAHVHFQQPADDDSSRKSKQFGFVSFEDPEAAEKAVKALDGNDNAGKILYVGRAQTKIEKQAELKEKFERIRMERINRYQRVNLYVKNLDDNIDDERLRKEFAQFGTITSAKAVYEELLAKNSSEEASKAIEEMDGRIVVAKPLYVTLAQKKEDCEARLVSQYNVMQHTCKTCMIKQGEQREQGVNVYVKNLDDNIDDERLRKEFAQFGTITNAKV